MPTFPYKIKVRDRDFLGVSACDYGRQSVYTSGCQNAACGKQTI